MDLKKMLELAGHVGVQHPQARVESSSAPSKEELDFSRAVMANPRGASRQDKKKAGDILVREALAKGKTDMASLTKPFNALQKLGQSWSAVVELHPKKKALSDLVSAAQKEGEGKKFIRALDAKAKEMGLFTGEFEEWDKAFVMATLEGENWHTEYGMLSDREGLPSWERFGA